MIIFLILAFTTRILAQTTPERIVCNGVIFHHVYFDKKLLFSNLGRPNNLIIHKFSNTLFLSHTIQNGTLVDFGIMACNIEKRTCTDIPGVPGGYAIAYDDGNDDIYFGGHDGIYKYNFLSKSAEYFAEQGKSIWSLFIKKNFYYIEYPSQKLYVYEDDAFAQVFEAIGQEIDHFSISKHGDIYISNETALYKIDKGTREPIVLNDEIVVRQIVEDSYGDVYFCSNTGIYLEDKPYHRVKKVADINQAFGLAFDENDHIIYSDAESVYKLVPSKYANVCLNAIYYPIDNIDRETLKRGLIMKVL